MDRKEMVDACVEILNKADQCAAAWDVAAFALSHALTGQQTDALKQLVEAGPVWDGDLISKSGRSELINMGLVSKAIVKGEEGYQVANYRGYAVYRAKGKLIAG